MAKEIELTRKIVDVDDIDAMYETLKKIGTKLGWSYLAETIFFPRPGKVRAIKAWHGTTSRLEDIIKKRGLVPREKGAVAVSSPQSRADRVYFGRKIFAKQLADGALEFYGGRKMLIKAKFDAANACADEDSLEETWHESLGNSWTLAYCGAVPTKNLTFEISKGVCVPTDMRNWFTELYGKAEQSGMPKARKRELCEVLQRTFQNQVRPIYASQLNESDLANNYAEVIETEEGQNFLRLGGVLSGAKHYGTARDLKQVVRIVDREIMPYEKFLV